MKFKILRGLHSHGGRLYGPRDLKTGDLSSGCVGDIVESDVDLVTRHGPEKFQRVYETEPVDELDGMSVSELMEYAEGEEIELGTAKRKADIIKAIRGAGPVEAMVDGN